MAVGYNIMLESDDLNELDKSILSYLENEGRATPSLIQTALQQRGVSTGVRQNISARLRRLREHGHVENVHDSGVYAFVSDPRAHDDEPASDAEPAVATAVDEVDDDILDGIDFPARGEYQRQARADAIRHAAALIRERGKIETSEMMDIVWNACDREEIGYSASEAGRGEWWTLYDSCLSDALKQVDGVEAPPPRSTPSKWRWVGVDE